MQTGLYSPQKGKTMPTKSKHLTDAAVRKFTPGAKERRIPTGMPGLFLVIKPSGRKSWQMRFRTVGGRIGKMTLGKPASDEMSDDPVTGSELTLAAARELANRVIRERGRGHDPIAAHKAEKARQRAVVVETATNTFAAAAQEFIEKYAKKKTRRWQEQARLLGLRPTKNGLEIITGGLAARWKDKPIGKMDGHDIHGIVTETRERGAPGLERRADTETESRARAMLSVLSRMYRWLLQHRRVEVNPCMGVHRPEPPKARDRVLNVNPDVRRADELRWFWTGCEKLSPPWGALLKILLLTGCRRDEIGEMRWDELTDDLAVLRLEGSRTKNGKAHELPLQPLTRDLLRSVDRIEGSPYVFTGATGKTPISGWSKTKNRLDALMRAEARKERGKDFEIADWRIHDLRRTAASGMQRIGIRGEVIERALNHISGSFRGVAGIYQRDPLTEEVNEAFSRWARHVRGVVSGQPDNVVAIRKRRTRETA
jgi:integrase